jgi:hypothetical protein
MIDLVFLGLVQNPISHQEIKNQIMNPTGENGYICRKHGFYAFKLIEGFHIQITQARYNVKGIDQRHRYGKAVDHWIFPRFVWKKNQDQPSR